MYSTYENNKIKLKTGTILRRIGYDRGRYVVKYNFLRRLAGSHENVLIDEDGAIHTGDYHVMPNGTIMTGATHEESTSKPLTLKEYKYFVHEISPSRREVRLAPQRINDSKYIDIIPTSFTYSKKVALNFVLDNTSLLKYNCYDKLNLILSMFNFLI